MYFRTRVRIPAPPFINYARWGPFNFPHLAARSPFGSLAAAGAAVSSLSGAPSRSPPRCALAIRLACGRRRCCLFAQWGPFTFPTSLRARHSARLRPQALLSLRSVGPLHVPHLAARSPSARSRPQALPSSLGGPLHQERSVSSNPTCRRSLKLFRSFSPTHQLDNSPSQRSQNRRTSSRSACFHGRRGKGRSST